MAHLRASRVDLHPKVSQACGRLQEALDTLEATLEAILEAILGDILGDILGAILEAIPTMDIQAVHLGCIRIQVVTHLQACQCTGQVVHRLVLTGQLFSQ